MLEAQTQNKFEVIIDQMEYQIQQLEEENLKLKIQIQLHIKAQENHEKELQLVKDKYKRNVTDTLINRINIMENELLSLGKQMSAGNSERIRIFEILKAENSELKYIINMAGKPNMEAVLADAENTMEVTGEIMHELATPSNDIGENSGDMQAEADEAPPQIPPKQTGYQGKNRKTQEQLQAERKQRDSDELVKIKVEKLELINKVKELKRELVKLTMNKELKVGIAEKEVSIYKDQLEKKDNALMELSKENTSLALLNKQHEETMKKLTERLQSEKKSILTTLPSSQGTVTTVVSCSNCLNKDKEIKKIELEKLILKKQYDRLNNAIGIISDSIKGVPFLL